MIITFLRWRTEYPKLRLLFTYYPELMALKYSVIFLYYINIRVKRMTYLQKKTWEEDTQIKFQETNPSLRTGNAPVGASGDEVQDKDDKDKIIEYNKNEVETYDDEMVKFNKVDEMKTILSSLNDLNKLNDKLKTILTFILRQKYYLSNKYHNTELILLFYDEVKKFYNDRIN